jgi:uncharacterized membrane protein YfcA
VRYRAAMLISAAGMALSLAGLWLARRINNYLLTAFFATVLLYVAYQIWRQASHTVGKVNSVSVRDEQH